MQQHFDHPMQDYERWAALDWKFFFFFFFLELSKKQRGTGYRKLILPEVTFPSTINGACSFQISCGSTRKRFRECKRLKW